MSDIVVVHAANQQTVVTTGWSNPTAAFDTITDGSFATASPGKNATVNGDFGFANFTTAEIPDGSTINSVTITINWGMSAAVAGGTLGAQLRNNGVNLGTETTQTATTQQNATQVVLTGVSLSDLRSASSLIKARVRCSKGNTSSAMTGNLDFVSLTVDYTPPRLRTIIQATRRAFRDASRLARSPGAVAILAATPVQSVKVSVNKPIPFTVTAKAHLGPFTTLTPAVKVVKRRSAKRRRGHVTHNVAVTVPVLHGTVNQRVPISISARAVTAAIATTHRPVVAVQRKRTIAPHGGVISFGLLLPTGGIHATLNKPIPIGISSSVDVPPPLAYWSAVISVDRLPPKPRRGRVTAIAAPVVRGFNARVNRAIPISITSAGVLNIDGTVNQPLPISITAHASANVDATVNQKIPVGISSHTSVEVDGTVNKPIPISIISAATTQAGRSGSLNKPIPFTISAHSSVEVDGAVNQRIVFGILSHTSVTMRGVVNEPIPITIEAGAVGPLGNVELGPGVVDILSQPSLADVLSKPSNVNVLTLPASVGVLSLPVTVNILSSESTTVPNLQAFLKVGDTSSPLLVQCGPLDATGLVISPDDLTGCTVTVNLARKSGKTLVPVVTGGACSVVDPVNGKVQYNWGPTDSATAGTLVGEFKSVDGSGKIKRYPQATNFTVTVTPAIA